VSSITASGGGVFIDQNPFPSVGREEIALLKRGQRGGDSAVHAQTHLVKKIRRPVTTQQSSRVTESPSASF